MLVRAAGTLFVVSLGLVIFVSFYRPPVQKADAIIILGAAINTPALYNRSLEGLRLYEQGKAPVIVLSGGVDYFKSIPEAQYMKNVILQHTSSTPVLILEPDSRSTYDNIENSKKLIPNAHSVIIVSDTFHLARGVAMAHAAGFSNVYWSAPDSPSYYPVSELVFHYFRESVAMIAYIPKFITTKVVK